MLLDAVSDVPAMIFGMTDAERAEALVRIFVIWGLSAIGASILGGLLAAVKNRNIHFWIGWCFVLPPMVLIVLLLPIHRGPRPRPPTLDEEDHYS